MASAAGFVVGDLALLDQSDDAEVSEGDCGTIFKRTSNYGVSQRVEIASIAGSTLTLTTALHWTFKTAQKATLSRVSSTPTKWAGIEGVLVQGGRPGGYPGQSAGGIDVSNAAYSWVKNVQVDGTTSGMPIRLAGTYRCVIRDSHFHNSYSYGFAQDNYGIVLACGAADNLVENNIARFMNKPILFNNSGGGNVVGYNYADNEWSCDSNDDDGFQESSVDCHCAFPHMELLEGNWAPHMGASITHGNAGYLTYFRNYASSQLSPSKSGTPTSAIIWSQPFAPQYANVGALQFDSPDVNMTVIGNVLGSTGDASLGLPADLGDDEHGARQPRGHDPGLHLSRRQPAVDLPRRHDDGHLEQPVAHGQLRRLRQEGDVERLAADEEPARVDADPPRVALLRPEAGLVATGHGVAVGGPDLSPRVGTLPAQATSRAFDYYTGADASCALNCGSYCCSVGSTLLAVAGRGGSVRPAEHAHPDDVHPGRDAVDSSRR